MSNQLMLAAPPNRVAIGLTARCPAGVPAGTVHFTWPSAVRKVWRRPEQIPVSTWAERYRVMDNDSPHPGPWRNDTSAYLVDIMDAFALPFVHELAICAPPQTGKTEVILNALGFVADMAPGPAMVVYQTQDMARGMATGRVRRMFEQAPRLRQYLSGKDDDLSNFLVKLRHMRIDFAWATSVHTLSNRSVQYVFLDEVDKYEATNAKEAGPVNLARKRLRAYKHTYKLALASSPSVATGEITLAVERAQVKMEYRVKCPDCGMMHVMYFKPSPDGRGGVRWPEDERDPEHIQSKRLAYYACPECGSVWDDFKRDKAVCAGHWYDPRTGMECKAYLRRYRPRSVAFVYNTLIAPDVSLSETAARFVLAQSELKVGRIDAYKDWTNGYMSEPWEEDFSPRPESSILALRDDRPAGILPGGGRVALLLATVDTQDSGWWYEIRAWGYGQECESWAVRQGYVQTLSALGDVLWIPYKDADGLDYTVYRAAIDYQGHKSREVIDYAILHRGKVIPLRGEPKMREPHAFKQMETYPGTDKKIPGGIGVLRVNSKYYKDALHSKLCIPPADPGAWHMHSETTEPWAKMMCAEYVDDSGAWACPKGRDNHAWDVSYYSYALADYFGTRFMQPPDPDEPDEEPETAQPMLQPRRRRW